MPAAATAPKRKWNKPEAAVIAPVMDDWLTAVGKKKKPIPKKNKMKSKAGKAADVGATTTKLITSFLDNAN